MAVEIVTGFQGKPHVTANDTACFNQGVVGSGEYVLNVGKKFSATVVTNNQIRIEDGEAVMQGIHFRIHPNTYENVTIENGNQGVKRKDIIVARYTKERSTGIEKIQIVVVKGTPSADNPLVPSLKKGDIRVGTETNEMLLYVVNIDGLNVISVTKSFEEVMSVAQVQKVVEDINKKRLQKLSEVMLATQSGFLVDALAVKELKNEMTEDLSEYFTINFGWSVNRQSFKRVGNLVFISFTVHPTENWSTNKTYTVFKSTLPEKYKPKINAISCGVGANGDLSQPSICVYMVDGKTGNIQTLISKDGAQDRISGYFSCNMMYPIKGVDV